MFKPNNKLDGKVHLKHTDGYGSMVDAITLSKDQGEMEKLKIWTETALDNADYIIHQLDQQDISQYEKNVNIARFYNKQINDNLKEHKKFNKKLAKKITCKVGCSACCYQHVYIADFEASNIVYEIKERGIEIDLELLDLQSKNEDHKEHEKLPHEKRKCVFLGTDNKCSIYNFRPLSCRKYFSLDDPIKCNTDTVQKIKRFQSPLAEIIQTGIMNKFEGGTLATQIKNQLIQYEIFEASQGEVD